MALKILIDARYRHRGKSFVSINPKLSRLVIYKEAYIHLNDSYGGDVEFVQILTDDERPGCFWLRPCGEDAPGARKFDITSTNTRSLSIRALMTELKMRFKETVRVELEWDEDAKAGFVDLSEILEKSNTQA